MARRLANAVAYCLKDGIRGMQEYIRWMKSALFPVYDLADVGKDDCNKIPAYVVRSLFFNWTYIGSTIQWLNRPNIMLTFYDSLDRGVSLYFEYVTKKGALWAHIAFPFRKEEKTRRAQVQKQELIFEKFLRRFQTARYSFVSFDQSLLRLIKSTHRGVTLRSNITLHFLFLPFAEGWKAFSFCQNIYNVQNERSEAPQSRYIFDQHQIPSMCVCPFT